MRSLTGYPVALVVVPLLIGACAGAPTPTASPVPASPTAPTSSPTATAPASPTVSPSSAPPTARPPAEWAEQIPSDGIGPSGREDHTLTVDPSTGIAYLFGGRDGGTGRGDLWTFDLSRHRWFEVSPADSPAGRFGHEAAWVDGVGLVVWAGQGSATRFFDDLWAYDPETNEWRELPQPGARPVARYGSCSGLGPDGRLWISHGFTADDGRFADTWAYDFAAGRWSETTPGGRGPVERCLHGCWWTDDGRFVLYAGQTTGVTALDDLWVLVDPGAPSAAWQRVEFERPPARNLYAFARDGASTVVVGGLGNDGYLADAFRLDDATFTPSPIEATGTAPAARSGASLVADPALDRLLLFGGRSSGRAFADTWILLGP